VFGRYTSHVPFCQNVAHGEQKDHLRDWATVNAMSSGEVAG